MDDILIYITEHSISIIFLIVLILLAIIGYYAEKANDGRNKKNEHSNDVQSNEQTGFISETEAMIEQKNETNILEESNDIKLEELNSNLHDVQTETANADLNVVQNDNELLPNEIPSVNNDIQENIVPINETEKEQKNEIIFNKEEINKFNEEFDAILPKKEIIDSDLLSDIDDLELDKTQKIDLSGVPDLDNIELPKIRQMDKEEDIWKF